MENILPINGRIAIVDDKIEQALPLMQVLSKNNIPYTYYDGSNSDNLPEKPENDIRILFLDLNLLGGKIQKEAEIKSSLIGTLKHIISPNNYPYILILWSRQEHEYKSVVDSIFAEDLKDCAPIDIKTFVKSDFFPNFSEEVDESKDKQEILEELKNILNQFSAYTLLLQWENLVHTSADSTINDIFKDFHSYKSWHDNANCILDMFASSYLEKQYQVSSANEKAKSSMLFFNDVFHDTLEQSIEKTNVENASDLKCDIDESQKTKIRSKINSHLLISKLCGSINQPGTVFSSERKECNQKATTLLYDSLSIADLRKKANARFPNSPDDAKKEFKRLLKEKKQEIQETMISCGVVVTPACDHAQKKAKVDRIVLGVIIDEKYKEYIDSKSEAIYISPIFSYNGEDRILVLNYRYFITQILNSDDLKSLFRVRNSVLSEIQSKLARHISRQGIMNL